MSVEPGSVDVNLLMARVDELEAEMRSLRRAHGDAPADTSEPVSRRRVLGMLKGAAAATAGAVVIGSSESAHATGVTVGAADGDALQIGGNNTNTNATTRLSGTTTGGGAPIFRVDNGNTSGSAIAFSAVQVGSGASFGFGIEGYAAALTGAAVFGSHGGSAGNNAGVRGASFTGAGLQVQDNLDAYASPSTVMPPTTGTWETGCFVNSGGQLWYCYVEGVGSASKWVRLSSSFVPVTPTRVYDSRVGTPLPTGILAAGFNRTVSVADGRNGAGGVSVANLVPAGATAVTANVTVTGTTSGFGYLAINPGGNTVEGASSINWFGAGQTLANGVTLTLNGTRQLTVICNGAAGASTHFIVDVSGYYL